MSKNLISLNQIEKQIEGFKLIINLKPELKPELEKLENQVKNMRNQIENFNNRFSDRGWCAYDSMNSKILEKANNVYEDDGIDVAEQVLIEYYQNEVKDVIMFLTGSSKAFSIRYDLIHQFFEDHFAKRYYASVPLGLIIIDGAVNDFTKEKGFFAEKTSLDAWDCLVGCSNGLQKLKDIFNASRKKTTTEKITLPYRNGILHGRDLNYANKYVSCKCVSLMFAVADWMRMKESESKRKEEYKKSTEPISFIDTIREINENKKKKAEIAEWKARKIVVGVDIPSYGTKNDYKDYPYVIPVIEMLEAWKNKNYGQLSNYLKLMFDSKKSPGARAGECRKLFKNKILKTYEIVDVVESGCSMSKIDIKVIWTTNNKVREEILTFNSIYMSEDNQVALPWRNNGQWTLKPLEHFKLYQ